MTNEIPRVSIGLPVYNGENYLADAIDSALAQTFPDFELIISDNASTDRTPEICIAYAEKDSRVHYYRVEENKGAAWNFNRVFELSKGEYFKWLAHDDKIAPTFLEEAVKVLDAQPDIVLISSKIEVIDQDGIKIDEFDIQLNTAAESPRIRFRDLLLVWHNCFEIFGLIRKDALEKTALMGNYTSGDSVLLTHLGLMGRYYKVPQFLIISRRHPLQSNVVYGSPKTGWVDQLAYNRWFNPLEKRKYVFPQWKILSEYARVINQTKLELADRIWCHLYLFRWLIRYRKPLLQDLTAASQIFFSRLFTKAGKETYSTD